ncbi:hypothetical protein ACU5RK_001290 [Campylobacter upsaliensis]
MLHCIRFKISLESEFKAKNDGLGFRFLLQTRCVFATHRKVANAIA